MFSLGGFVFGLQDWVAPDQMTRGRAWVWADQERIGQMSGLQHTGKTPDTLSIPGYIYPGQIGNAKSLDQLAIMANAGKPYLLVDIDGWVRGKWVITDLKETRTHLAYGSIPLKIEFTLELKRYAG